ncbi:YqgE/AlgH family protein [Lacibacter luteus]|uniref:YqgE/AlgH family protein n=1 Tax=Lacibacter luteus TaxID=2508719 RepID=A0A4Q1CGV5_9BACT|nr:YqgE/AlgH family protein [Lacibacter luteus]
MQEGSIIISTAMLNDTAFDHAAVIITEHNEKGAMGYVFNKLFPRNFNELVEFKNAVPVPLYEGGPVQTDMLYFMHCRPDLIEGSDIVAKNICVNGDFKKAVQLLNNGTLTVDEVRLFIGYCGWDAGELEAEIEEGSWQLTNAPVDFVFSLEVAAMWNKLHTSYNI